MKLLAAALGLTLLATAPPKPAALRLRGHWEIVRGRTDGRLAGASARSFHAGDALEADFAGRGFRIFGITGPTGGHAIVVVARQPDRSIDFYSPVKRTHVLVYASPPLPEGVHLAAVVVVPSRDAGSRGNYVNIDSVEVVP